MQTRLEKILRRTEFPCWEFGYDNLFLLSDIIFGGRRVDSNDGIINYYMGVSCIIKRQVIDILKSKYSVIAAEDKDRIVDKIRQILERYGYAGLNLSYYAGELLGDCLVFDWDGICDSVDLEMVKYLEKAKRIGNVLSKVELSLRCGHLVTIFELEHAAIMGHPRAAFKLTNMFSNSIEWLETAVCCGSMQAAEHLYLLDKKDKVHYIKVSTKYGHIKSFVYLGLHYEDLGKHWKAFRCFVKGFVESNDDIVAKINAYSVQYFGFQIPIETFEHVGVNSLRGLCLVSLFD